MGAYALRARPGPSRIQLCRHNSRRPNLCVLYHIHESYRAVNVTQWATVHSITLTTKEFDHEQSFPIILTAAWPAFSSITSTSLKGKPVKNMLVAPAPRIKSEIDFPDQLFRFTFDFYLHANTRILDTLECISSVDRRTSQYSAYTHFDAWLDFLFQSIDYPHWPRPVNC